MFTESDLTSYVTLGKTLWPRPEQAIYHLKETASAVALTVDESAEQWSERLFQALFRQGLRGTEFPHRQDQVNPFHHLSVPERFLLIALQRLNWSYSKISRVMEMDYGMIEEIAWSTRLELLILSGSYSTHNPWRYPLGGKDFSSSCPEFDVRKPWTQRFLDQEITHRGRFLFLQNHLRYCKCCNELLTQTKNLYFNVERILPRFETDQITADFSKICKDSRNLLDPSKRTFLESLAVFWEREDVRWVVYGVVLLLIISLWR